MNDDATAMVDAVINVLAPQILGPPGYAPVRLPVFRFDYDGVPVVPDDTQVRALAESIVTAIRTVTTPAGWAELPDGTWERPVRGGLTGVVSMGERSEQPYWSWAVLARHGQVTIKGNQAESAACKAADIASSEGAAKTAVDRWEAENTC